MGIVIPVRESGKSLGSKLNGSQGGSVQNGGIAPALRHVGAAAPNLNGGSGNAIPGYGSALGGPYQPVNQPQSTRSSQAPLH